MNGFITEDGEFISVPLGKHYKYLINNLKLSEEEAERIPFKWVLIKPWTHVFDNMINFLNYRYKFPNGFSCTERNKYTLSQLEFLKKNKLFIDTTKI